MLDIFTLQYVNMIKRMISIMFIYLVLIRIIDFKIDLNR